MSNSNIAIIGLGMTTAVGFDHKTACASFRAGITRIKKLDSYRYFDDEENEDAEISAHVASPNFPDAEGLGNILALGLHAFDDLIQSSKSLSNQPEIRTGFILALPDLTFREDTEIDDDATGDIDLSYGKRFKMDCDQLLIPRLLKTSRCNVDVVKTKIRYGDHCSFFLALQDGIASIISGEVDRCIVGGIDSYLDELSLDWGLTNKRIKTENNSAGFIPGEAAAFILIENLDRALQNGVDILAKINSPVIKQEEVDEDVNKPAMGGALGLAILEVVENADCQEGYASIGNLNGEVSYAREWGNISSKLIATYPSFKQLDCSYPAESFGETGCASIGLSIGVCIQSFDRNYSNSDNVLIWSISDTENRGALLVTKNY